MLISFCSWALFVTEAKKKKKKTEFQNPSVFLSLCELQWGVRRRRRRRMRCSMRRRQACSLRSWEELLRLEKRRATDGECLSWRVWWRCLTSASRTSSTLFVKISISRNLNPPFTRSFQLFLIFSLFLNTTLTLFFLSRFHIFRAHYYHYYLIMMIIL